MTVCVAAMANNGLIVCAADRMLTRGVTESEPDAAKIYNVTHGFPLTVMWAGSAAVFGEVIQDYFVHVKQTPEKYQSVGACVDLYCKVFLAYLGNRAEREVLGRLGLTRRDLISNQVTDRRAGTLIDLVTSFDVPDEDYVESIFAGHDASGSHIWRTLNAKSYCQDIEGVAVIGTGASLALAQMQLMAHTPKADMLATIIGVYFAKRRAEGAVGVGKATDMCIRVDASPTAFEVPQTDLAAFGESYEDYASNERQALANAIRSRTEMMMSALKPREGSPLESAPTPPSASTGGP